MSEEMMQLESELLAISSEIEALNERVLEIEDKIHMQRLIDWMKINHLDPGIKQVTMNQEMHDYIVRTGYPGGYIEYELDRWQVGTVMTLKGKYDVGEGRICAAPPHNHSGLFPPDMIKRAIKEAIKTCAL